MFELSLFTGAGGGLLATRLLGWRTVGYVEFDDYCQRVIRQRITDGCLDDAPIFGDVRAFVSSGYAAAYQGLVDVITAGFPCQPFSVAGKRAGAADDRDMWPATQNAICAVRPRYVCLKNVPGLHAVIRSNAYEPVGGGWIIPRFTAHRIERTPYIGRVLSELAEAGYRPGWDGLSAAEVGAPHGRDRTWFVANAHGQ